MQLTGTADVNVQVRGPATSPVIGGSVRSSGARLLVAQSGIAINDINLDIGIGAGVARINRLTGNLSTGGILTASGTVGTEAAQGFPADIAITQSRTVARTFGTVGSFPYDCTLHPGMSGVIDVRP